MPSLSGPAFFAPRSIDDVLTALGEDGAMLLAGGTSMGVLLKNRLVEPESLVYLGRVPGLDGISRAADGSLEIGSMTTLSDIAASPLVRAHAPALAVAAGKVGNPRVRAIATLGGALVHGDPRQDIPPVMLALQATVRIVGRDGTRNIPMTELLLGFMESSVAADEIVTGVTVPVVDRREAYLRYTPNSDDDYPTVGVAVSIVRSRAGEILDAVVALGGVHSRAILVPGVADTLVGSRADAGEVEQIAQMASLSAEPTDDGRGSADYKRAMVEVWTRRTLGKCLE